MDGSGLPSKLLSTLSRAADIARSHSFIHLYSHFDADGISSISIVAMTLLRAGISFTTTVFPVLSPTEMDIIRKDDEDCIIITDLGASYISEIDSLRGDSIVLDHHTLGVTETEKTAYGNPHLYGIDGSTSGCGASMAFLFALAMDESNWDFSPIAIAGMVGDKQDLGGFTGLNTYIFEGAEKRGFVKKTRGSLIPFGDLYTKLYSNLEPYIDGVTGDADGTEALLKSQGISVGTSYSDLDDERRQALASVIATRLIRQGVTADKLGEAVRDRYILPTWNMDADTLADLLDVCGRNDNASTGIAAAMGDRSCINAAVSLSAELRGPLLKAVTTIRPTIKEMDHILWFDASSTGSAGILSGIVMSYLGNPSKPTIGYNGNDAMARVSTRATRPLLTRGVDMAVAMKEACAEAGGEGGGHSIAAGGQFPSENRDIFLSAADRIVGEQLKKA